MTMPTTGRPDKKLEAFDTDGVLDAQIRRTEFGVPHIKADNLESLGFGVGYAFAQDNAYILADIIMRYNRKRQHALIADYAQGYNRYPAM